jgi:para-aminobenzoate synthetase component 1
MSTTAAALCIQELCPYDSWEKIPEKLLARPYSFFLDSAGGRFPRARYSFLGSDPFLVFKCTGQDITLEQNGQERRFREDPFVFLKGLMGSFKVETETPPAPFIGGAVGYFGYDLARIIETVPDTACSDIVVPDCCLGFYSAAIIVDHHERKVWIASSGLPEETRSLQRTKAQEDIEHISSLLADNSTAACCNTETETSYPAAVLSAHFDRESYCRAIATAKHHIAEGDIYQVNLSQRFSCPASIPPFALFKRLRTVSPAPFGAFFNGGDHHIICSSPEQFLRISGRIIETRPIKGTRPRGVTETEDRRLRDELLASAKDRAELIMIVDLERNDLGRVCRFGSIQTSELISLETHPVVHHLVATIRGEVAAGYDHIDCLRACFPGGSITGAPKIRAMEIIEELEPCRRKVYTGSLGYLGFNGESDLNILIRTILHAHDSYYFHVGGGIVADSVPDLEYEETLHKARGIMEALGMIFST